MEILLVVVAGVFGILGAVVGVLVNEWMAQQREGQAEKKQGSAARVLLNLEIDKNLTLLREFWERINETQESDQKSDSDRFHLFLANRLANLPMPVWSNSVLESQLSILPLALSSETIRQIFDLRSGLDTISNIYSKIMAIEQPGGYVTKNALEAMIKHHEVESLNKKVSVLWQELETTANRVLEKGNPLKG